MIKSPEIRHDLISGNWVIIAPKRGKRPSSFLKNKPRLKASKTNCPFEDPLNNQEVILLFGHGAEWEIATLQNKYPALIHGDHPLLRKKNGAYELLRGFGHHDVVVTRDHDANFPRLSPQGATDVFKAFRDRCQFLKRDKEVAYVSIFHNWGSYAGASIYHPHYQMIAVPIVPKAVEVSLDNSGRFFRKRKHCMHDFVIDHELKVKKRIIFRNKSALVVAPYVSREPFQLRVYPLRHFPYFEATPEEELRDVALALREALRRVERKLHDPDYNFFIHTAPMKHQASYRHYHWHIEIIPKLSIDAGFELGTGIQINSVDPDDAAKILRG